MEHALQLDVEAMRRAGYATVDALVARLADPRADPVLRRAAPETMQALLGGGAPEGPSDYSDVLARVARDVLPYASRTDHPGYFAFVPSFTTWPAALAELVAAASNPYCGAWMESAAATQIELEVLGWFRDWLGMPAETAGLLVTGGSAANLTAMLVAREAAGGPSDASVVYLSDQAHSSLPRTARAMGLRPEQIRVLPSDAQWRLTPSAVRAAVQADRRAGRVPVAVCASAGSTNTGTVDPLGALADVCAEEELWLHVDAAYGGFAALTADGRTALSGIERADSVTLDPHKWLFQPMECGSVLVRDGALLERTFAIHPDYLDDNDAHGIGEVNFADRGLQLSRGFRALKIWMSVQTFGLAAFRDTIARNIELAQLAEQLVRERPELTLAAPAALGIVCFRREWPGCTEDETVARGAALVASLAQTGDALVSTTRLAGRHAIRLCVLNPTSAEQDVRRVIDHFADADAPAARTSLDPAPEARSDAVAATDSVGGSTEGWAGELRQVALLSTLSAAGLHDLVACAQLVDVAAGEAVVRQWEADRSFYVVLSGTYEIDVDGEIVRAAGAGDFFGELAARDWGGGYGYARLATVWCTQAGRLLLLPGASFRTLLDQEPSLRAQIEAAVAERLRRT
ncbi:MAG: Pyridoxal-dependent decarboxylase [Pseudonocardiales bacterium]|nr:Pyridoxal-dependent decarboxylase [Pseudonocardiales bacterium]